MKTILSLPLSLTLALILSLTLSGCVNLHVHFPEAAGKPAEPAQDGAAK